MMKWMSIVLHNDGYFLHHFVHEKLVYRIDLFSEQFYWSLPDHIESVLFDFSCTGPPDNEVEC